MPVIHLRRTSRPCRRRERRRSDERGFSLVESLISMGIAASGLLAVAGLMLAGTTLQQKSRDGGQAGLAAVQQLEQLRVLPSVDPRIQVGGSLDQPITPANPFTNYHAFVTAMPSGRVLVRWQVLLGPANTREIRVRAIPMIAGARTAEVRSLVWRP